LPRTSTIRAGTSSSTITSSTAHSLTAVNAAGLAARDPRRFPVDDAAPNWQPAKVDVLRYAEVGDERELLVERRHASALRLVWVTQRNLLARVKDLPGVRLMDAGEDLCEG
jgi:hypothetical protein